MKHPMQPTLMLVCLFLVAQLIGIVIVGQYVDIIASHIAGITVRNDAVYQRVGVEPPVVTNESLTFIYVIAAVLVGTICVLLLMRFRKRFLWRVWYLLAVFFSLLIALNPFTFWLADRLGLALYTYIFTLLVAGICSAWKVFKPNIYIHNLTEIFIYGGIAALLVPVLNLFSAVVLLVLISLYDAYAVWKSKHMIEMATYQKESGLFAGLALPYGQTKDKAKTTVASRRKAAAKTTSKTESNKSFAATAILGGGDISFPLIFAGVVMKTMGSYPAGLIVVATTTVALAILLLRSEKGKFYPAMPFLSAGCLVGLLIWLAVA